MTAPLTLRLRHNAHLTAHSHGWPYLAPFSLQNRRLEWVAALPESGPRAVSIEWDAAGDTLRVDVDGVSLTEGDRGWLRESVAWMFRAEEDFAPFWARCRAHPTLAGCAEQRAGALIRSGSLFEDVVKTLCTVNCHWRNTKRMTAALCERFGEGAPGEAERFTFPTPEALAAATPEDLRAARLGYRAASVRGFAEEVASGRLDLEQWTRVESAEALRDELLRLRGVGPYAAHHLLVLLGHYRFIPCDSEVRAYLGLPPGASARETQRVVEARYGDWGEHAFLAYKFERVLRRQNYVDA